jgi:hypothetical protein
MRLQDTISRRRKELSEQREGQISAFPDGSTKEERLALLDMEDRGEAFLGFCRTYLPEYFPAPFGQFHRDYAQILASTGKPFHLVAAPPEHGKSLILIAYYMWCAISGDRHMVAHVSETKTIGETALDLVRIEMEGNPRILHDFGDLRHEKYQAQDFFAYRNFRKTHRHPYTAFKPFGYATQLRGWIFYSHRVDFAGLDDFEPISASRNPRIVAEREQWLFSEVYPRVGRTGALVWVHNNARRGSTADTLHKAVEEGTARKGIQSHKWAALGPDGPLWPERFTVEMLLDIQERVGRSAWRGDYQQEPITTGKRFNGDWIHTYALSDLPADLSIEARLDPSVSAKGDTKALVALGFSRKTRKYYVLKGTWVAQATLEAMVDQCYHVHETWRSRGLRSLRCEKSFAQQLIYGPVFEEAAVRHGYRVPMGWYASNEAKADRIARLEDPLSIGLILFPEGYQKDHGVNELVSQLLEWSGAPGDRDDGPDALEAAYSALAPQRRSSRGKETSLDKQKRYIRIRTELPDAP